MTDSLRACRGCGLAMPAVDGFDRCATCTYGPDFGRSSARARELIEAHAKRRPLELVTRGVSRATAEVHLDRFERGEARIQEEEIVRDGAGRL